MGCDLTIYVDDVELTWPQITVSRHNGILMDMNDEVYSRTELLDKISESIEELKSVKDDLKTGESKTHPERHRKALSDKENLPEIIYILSFVYNFTNYADECKIRFSYL